VVTAICGIVGIFAPSGRSPVERAALEAMAEALVHRGPDDAAVHLGPCYGFGFRRLAIVDLANGNQPMHNGERTVFSVCNGEIYNYPELRRELAARGCAFRTACDVEVIPHLYDAEG